MTWRIRVTTAATCLVVCVTAAPPQVAGAQSGHPTPSATGLWKDYPLHQRPKGVSDDLSRAVPAAAAASPTAQPAPAPERLQEGGSPWVLLLVLAALVAASTPLVLPRLRRRRRRDVGDSGSTNRSTQRPTAAPPSSGGQGAPGGVRDALARSHGAAAARSDAMPSPPPDPQRGWSAEIEWCEHGGEWRFRAVARPQEGAGAAIVAESAPLEWPPASDASVQELSGAAELLEAAMVTAGWKALASGGAWYAKRFAWEPDTAARAPTAPPQAPAPSRPARPASERAEPVTHPRTEEPMHRTARRDRPPPRPGRFIRASAWPEGSEAGWRCEIQLETAYGKSRLKAVVYSPRATVGHSIGNSGRFESAAEPDEKAPSDVAMADALASGLVRAGWEPAGIGGKWYAHRFVWRHDDRPPPQVEPDRTQAGRAR
jgi:hypothetical protein